MVSQTLRYLYVPWKSYQNDREQVGQLYHDKNIGIMNLEDNTGLSCHSIIDRAFSQSSPNSTCKHQWGSIHGYS